MVTRLYESHPTVIFQAVRQHCLHITTPHFPSMEMSSCNLTLVSPVPMLKPAPSSSAPPSMNSLTMGSTARSRALSFT